MNITKQKLRNISTTATLNEAKTGLSDRKATVDYMKVTAELTSVF